MEIRRARGEMEREVMVMMKEGGWKITEQWRTFFEYIRYHHRVTGTHLRGP
jgi:hypothetical protein